MATFRLPFTDFVKPVKPILVTIVRVFIGCLLLSAGLAKILDFNAFTTQVALYDILQMSTVRIASYCLLSAEITIGIALIVGYFSGGASILSAGLFAIFITFLSVGLLRDLSLEDCGCQNLIFNLFYQDVKLSWTIVSIDTFLLVGCLFVASTDSAGYGVDFFVRKKTLFGE